jgi:hypothetical protein
MEMIDLRNESIEIKVSEDGKTVWVNSPTHCILRAQNIPTLTISESPKQLVTLASARFIYAFLGIFGGSIIATSLMSYLEIDVQLNVFLSILVATVIGLIGYLRGRKLDKGAQK